eukprot:SAG11_NODE_705_length_7655_cov_19.812599_3_plen_66_part_00
METKLAIVADHSNHAEFALSQADIAMDAMRRQYPRGVRGEPSFHVSVPGGSKRWRLDWRGVGLKW